jgi:hypothetical protein
MGKTKLLQISGIVNYIDFNDEATNYEDMF